MTAQATQPVEVNAEWCTHHFDHLSPAVAGDLHHALGTLREACPVAHSDQWGGFWIVSKYEDVLRVVQDWQTFSSANGITVPHFDNPNITIPEQMDPPQQREFKKLINYWFRPEMVLKHEANTRQLVNQLIDGFIEKGECDFQKEFAGPLPGLIFFKEFMHAPAEELAEINRLASLSSKHTTEEGRAARQKLMEWIAAFAEKRRGEREEDVVDAVLHAEIEGRPITQSEIISVIQLLLFGGLDTTAGALGAMMTHFAQQPEILESLAADPSLVENAVEELLRMDGPFAFIGRYVTQDVEVGGQLIKAGDRVIVSWISANNDEDEFPAPREYNPQRSSNRHIAFGAGPHRCAGSNLARMNLRISVTEIARRMKNIRLADDKPIQFHPGFSRAPESVRIAFTPGPRES
jgi:cytochrome P450